MQDSRGELNMKKFLFALIFLICTALCGCSSQSKEIKYKFDTSENIFEIEENDDLSTDIMGAYNIHYRDIDTDKGIVATEKNITIPISIESLGYKTNVGIIMVLDGKPMAFSTDEDNKKTTIKKYTVEKDKSIDIVLNSEIQQGQKGDKVPLYIIGILEPDYIPQTEDDVSYGNYQKELSLLPVTVDVECNIKERNQDEDKVVKEDISSAEYEENNLGNGENALDSICQWTIEESNGYENKILADNGIASFKLEGEGGDTATYDVICFINNKPIQTDSQVNKIVSVEKGKKTIIDYNIDISSFDRINSLYFIIVPTADCYLNDSLSLFKTNSKLLINDTKNEQEAKEGESFDISGIKNNCVDYYWMGENNVAFFENENTFVVYDLKNGKVVKKEKCSDDNVYSRKVSYMKDGIIVYGIGKDKGLTGTEYADIYYRDLTSSHIDFKDYLRDACYEYHPICVSRDEKQIAYISDKNRVKIYDIESKKTNDIASIQDIWIVNMDFSWDGKSIVFSGKENVNGIDKNGFGFINIKDKDMKFYSDDNADSRLQVTENGVYIDAKAALYGETGDRNLYRITNDGYEKISVQNPDEAQKVNVSLSGKFFVTQDENILKVYKAGEKEPIKIFKNENYNSENVSGNALILEKARTVLCSFDEEEKGKTYYFMF